jgi:glutaminase
MIKPELSVDKRLKYIMNIWSRLCGNTPIKINKDVVKSEGKSSMRNMALSYYMQEQDAFPEDTDIYKTMELYNKCCAIEVNIDQLAMTAATLANGGIGPVTGDSF